MLRTWWPSRPAQAGEDTPDTEDGATNGTPLAVGALYQNHSDLPQQTLNVWTMPFSAPPEPDEVSAALTVVIVPELYYAFTGNQLPAPAPAPAPRPPIEWWLPPPSPRAITLVPRDAPPLRVRRPNYIDRIAMLHDLRGRFDPDQVAELI